MPGILTRSSGNLSGNKFKTVLGLSSLQTAAAGSNSASAYDAEHEDELDANQTLTPTTPPTISSKPRSRKLRARIPLEQRSPEPKMPPSVDIKANRAARPVRVDAEDGLWTVSVAEASPRAFTIYIKTPTHHLTLTRSSHEIAELHGKIQDQLPATTELPPCPLESEPPQKRKSSFLTTLSRLASPPKALPNPQLTPPQDEITDPFLAAEPSATTSLASYLTTLSNDKTVRGTRAWKRFVRVRTDDLESTRIERTIKRVRSDIAVHTGTSGALTSDTPARTPAGSSADRDAGSSALAKQRITEEDGFLGVTTLIADDASAEENARRLIDSGMVDFTPPPVLPTPAASPRAKQDKPAEVQKKEPKPEPKPDEEEEAVAIAAEEEPTEAAPAKVQPESVAEEKEAEVEEAETHKHEDKSVEDDGKTVEEHPSRIPRSVSADPDKASRLSRTWQESPVPAQQSETEGEATEAEVTEATDAEDTDAFAGAMSDAGGAQASKPRKKKKKQKLEKKPRKVVIDDFEMLRVLGKGCAGKVLLVRYKKSNALYALKAITKRHVLAHQELQHTMTEQAVLKRMARSNSDPFVVKLYWSFHDRENLFLVMDFHPGGDLATQLARWGRLGRDRARFYAAEIVEGVEGLHAAGVIYRDLKPENILIGGDGHIVLTDFGLSKQFPRRRPGSITAHESSAGGDYYASSPATPTGENHHGMPYWMNNQSDHWLSSRANDTTSTFCGTAEYLAPEVIQGLPYSYEVDWWSFGTMLYEMLTGITPFWANNHSDMYVRVLQDELTFPEDRAMDQDTKSLVRGLLQRNPALRLCEPRIKRHPYFSMIDWQHVYHKRYIPPYIPPIDPANASDTQNFDDAFLEMEPILDTDMENDDQTGSERDRSTTDLDASNLDEEPNQALANGSPAVEAQDEPDIFDGYSFKARNSVIIEDDDDGNEGSDETDGEVSIKRQSIVEQPEDELEAGQKTPDAHINVVPPTPTPASAVVEAFRKQQEAERAAAASPTVEGVDKYPGKEQVPDHDAPKTPTNKVEELDAEATPITASPEKALPKPPAAKEEAPKAPAPVEKEKKVVTISEKPKTKVVDHPKPKAVRNVKPARRERSGVAALDRDLSDVLDEDEVPAHDEDDDWDFVEALGAEDYNGQQGKSLFARGVVDRYRLRVFRKPTNESKSRTLQRNPSSATGASSTNQAEFGEMPVAASPTPSDKKRGRGGGLSLRKPKTFLRAKSPAATYSAGSGSLSRPAVSTQHSATISGSSSGVLVTPSASTPLSSLAANGNMSLKSHPSMNSMGSPGSSDTSVNGNDLGRGSLTMSAAELASPGKSRGNNKSSPDLRRQARASTTDGDESRQKGLKKMRKYTEQGAEKVMSLFSSPRPSPSPNSAI